MQGVHQSFPEAVPEAGAQLCPGQGVQQPPGQPALHLAPDHDRRPGKRAYLCSYLFSLLSAGSMVPLCAPVLNIMYQFQIALVSHSPVDGDWMAMSGASVPKISCMPNLKGCGAWG